MKIIVFGGNGFVGQWCINRLLEQQHAVLCCDLADSGVNQIASYQKVDMRDYSQVSTVPFEEGDIIINLAANQYHGKVPKKNREAFFYDTNVLGIGHILQVALEKKCMKMIQFTTDMTYGIPQYLPVDIKHPQNPFGPYGKSKKDAEDLCLQYREKGMDITIFRPRMINGPGRLGILGKLFWLVEHNLPVPTIGRGNNCYQMVSVFDCVSAIICAIKKEIPNREYNLGSLNPPSIKELLKNLIKQVDSHSIVIPTPGRLVKFVLGILGEMGMEIMYKEQYMIADKDYVLDISETMSELEWTPEFADMDMIIGAYQNYQTTREEK